MRRKFAAALLAFACLVKPLSAEEKPKEILLHEGPELTTPGLGPKEEITFIKEFFVDAELLKKQPPLSLGQDPPLTAEKAILLAKDSIEKLGPQHEKFITRLELLSQDSVDPSNPQARISYYLIEIVSNGNEIHRVVLMDGTVIKSSLRRLGVHQAAPPP